jgi:hypothetical protein
MKTKKQLNGWDKLDAFIKAEAEANKPKQEGEFTVAEYRQKIKVLAQPIGETVARRKIDNLVKSGVLTSRKSIEPGNPTYYRFV